MYHRRLFQELVVLGKNIRFFDIRRSSVLRRNMSSKVEEDIVKSGKPLDVTMFSKTLRAIAISVETSKTNQIVQGLRKFLVSSKSVKAVQVDPESPSTRRLILFDPDVLKRTSPTMRLEIVSPALIVPSSLGTTFQELVGPKGEHVNSEHDISIGFDGMSVHEILKELLPEKEHYEIPSSFESCGCLARINLRDELMPYRYVIGEVILRKNKHIRTVVCKKGLIESKFRTLPLEIVAGEKNTIVDLTEHGVKFRFDYQTVYWNSRLSQVHHLVVEAMAKYEGMKAIKQSNKKQRRTKRSDHNDKKSESSVMREKHPIVVCDMMCGIGPFAIPAAKMGLQVLANDLNPESVKYLKINSKLNRVEDRVKCFNQDGREFVRDLLKRKIEFKYVLMNLPAIAIEFLDVFRNGVCDHFKHMPRIYCYCFSKEETKEERIQDVIARAEKALDMSLKSAKSLSVRDARDVAPQKMYMCIEFILPRSNDGNDDDDDGDEVFPKTKRVKLADGSS